MPNGLLNRSAERIPSVGGAGMFSPLSRETYRKGDPFPYVCERIVFAIKKGGTARPSSFCGEGFFAFFKEVTAMEEGW